AVGVPGVARHGALETGGVEDDLRLRPVEGVVAVAAAAEVGVAGPAGVGLTGEPARRVVLVAALGVGHRVGDPGGLPVPGPRHGGGARRAGLLGQLPVRTVLVDVGGAAAAARVGGGVRRQLGLIVVAEGLGAARSGERGQPVARVVAELPGL